MYAEILVICLHSLISGRDLHDVILVVWFGIPFVLPAFITLVCLGYQSRVLLRQTRVQSKESIVKQRKMTVTIFSVTTLFFVCSITYSVFWAVVCAGSPLGGFTFPWTYTMAVMLPMFNATVNPMIMVWRSRAMRGVVLQGWLCRRSRRVEGSTTTTQPRVTAVSTL